MGILPISKGGRIESFDGSATRAFPHIDAAGLARFHAIEARADAASDPYPKTEELMQALADDKSALTAYTARANGAPVPSELARLQERVERSQRALNLHHELTRSQVAVGHAFKSSRDDCLRFLNGNRDGGRKYISSPAEVPTKGATYESLVTKVGDIAADVIAANAAWPPLEDALAEARARVESEASRGRPRASIDVEPVGNPLRPAQRAVLNLRWSTVPLPAKPLHERDELLTIFDSEAAFTWFAKDAIIERVEADLRSSYDGYTGPTLTDAARRKRVADLKASRLTVERQLSSLIWQRIEAGDVFVTFPSEMNPLAVLEVQAR